MTYPLAMRDRFVDLVCAGCCLDEAGRRVGVSSITASRWWARFGHMDLERGHGGLVAGVPADRPGGGGQRARRALTGEDRAVIEAGLRVGLAPATIAGQLGRDGCVVTREVTRNRCRDGIYRSAVAHRLAATRRRRPKPFRLVEHPGLCRLIEGWMDQGWSPRLIAQVLKTGNGPDQTVWVSHETIYRALYVQTRGQLRADLHRQLSLKRRQRVPRTRDRHANNPYREAFTISQRPAEVDDRAVPGHWEGDLIVGPASKSAIGTLVERSTRFTILLHLPDRHDADTVAEAMIREMRHLPEHLRRSITWDRGRELAAYARVELALDTRLYFCDPHSPWQRGTNENTNGLLRQYFPKATDLSIYPVDYLDFVAAQLNDRPRKTLDWKTPAEAFQQLLSSPPPITVAMTG